MKERYSLRIPEREQKTTYAYMESKRAQYSKEIAQLLVPPSREIYQDLNYLIILIDRLVDLEYVPDTYFKDITNILLGEMSAATVANGDLIGQLVDKLRVNSEWAEIRRLLLEHFKNEQLNVARRWEVISRQELRGIQIGNSPFFVLEFFLLFPNESRSHLREIGEKYTFAAKVADDICDFQEDVRFGFLNVPKEALGCVKGIGTHGGKYFILSQSCSLLPNYVRRELSLAERIFLQGDEWAQQLDLLCRPSFCAFRKLMYSWIEEAKGTVGL